jgi:hypothetical protein
MRKKPPKIQQVEVTALIHRPRHLEAMGVLTVEITHMERALTDRTAQRLLSGAKRKTYARIELFRF